MPAYQKLQSNPSFNPLFAQFTISYTLCVSLSCVFLQCVPFHGMPIHCEFYSMVCGHQTAFPARSASLSAESSCSAQWKSGALSCTAGELPPRGTSKSHWQMSDKLEETPRQHRAANCSSIQHASPQKHTFQLSWSCPKISKFDIRVQNKNWWQAMMQVWHPNIYVTWKYATKLIQKYVPIVLLEICQILNPTLVNCLRCAWWIVLSRTAAIN